MATVEMQIQVASARQILPRDIRARLTRAYTRIAGEGEVTIRITSDEEVRQLNAQFRGKDRVTDVLSFPYNDDGVAGGDIVIAWQRATEQAEQRKISIAEETLRLAVHGLAHICGYRHDTPAQFAEMREVEAQALLACL